MIAIRAVAAARSKQAVADVLEARPLPRPDNPRVQVIVSPNGTVRIVGVTLSGEWVAEHTCKAARFGERHVRAMEREVLREESLQITPITRVIPFPTKEVAG